MAGTDWDTEIKRQLQIADIICLLVSKDFIRSDYIWGVEMKEAIAKHLNGEARIIPIFIRKVHNIGRLPFGKIQGLPRDSMPVTEWEDEDDAWSSIVEGVTQVIDYMKKK